MTAATELGGDVHVLVAAEDAAAAAAEAAQIAGVKGVLAASGAAFKGGIAENMTPLLLAVQQQTGANNIGKKISEKNFSKKYLWKFYGIKSFFFSVLSKNKF